MSDFLSNLVARSLGTPVGIRPRVPALYEPHQRHSGLLGERLQSREPDQQPQPEMDFAVESSSSFDRPLESSVQPSPEPSSRRVSDTRRQLDTQQPTQTSPSLPAKFRLEPIPIPRFSRTTPAGSNPALINPIPISGLDATRPPGKTPGRTPSEDSTSQDGSRGPLAEIRSQNPVKPPKSPEMHSMQPPETVAASWERAFPVFPSLIARPQADSPLPHRFPQPESLLQAESNRAELTTPNPIQSNRTGRLFLDSVRQRSEREPENPSTFTPAGHPSDSEPDSAILPAPRHETSAPAIIPANPVMVAHPAEPKMSPGPSPLAPPLTKQTSEPSIRVTIGRVEVRAIFPIPPANRTQPQRSRPTLSLDEYLKRNSGAGR